MRLHSQESFTDLCIPHDFQTAVIRDVLNGDLHMLWAADSGRERRSRQAREPSVHGKVSATLDERNRDLVLFEARDGVEFKDHGNTYSISCPSLDVRETRIAVPNTSFSSNSEVRKLTHITAFGVSPDGSQVATGYHDGSVHTRPASPANATPHATGKAHLSTATSPRFFPSSRVVLTSGADFSLSILPADPPESSQYTTTKVNAARTLRGHTCTVTCTGIIARSRNILSGSKDGTVRLWDIPSGVQICSLAAGANHFVPVLAFSTGEQWKEADGNPDHSPDSDASITDPREVDTSDKVVCCALQDSSFELFDLRTKRSQYRSKAGPPGARTILQVIAYSPESNLVAMGSGSCLVYDTRSLGDELVVAVRCNEAPIEDVAFVDTANAPFSLGQSAAEMADIGLTIATEDGLPYVVEVCPSWPRVRPELVGTDCDALRFVRAVGINIWSGADDGAVRRYLAN
ncbi:WD40 repeat-like protein [Ganoderma leucocontextum]|nr:WD40 repeat-like protein [Ganoderma leucocontextum]